MSQLAVKPASLRGAETPCLQAPAAVSASATVMAKERKVGNHTCCSLEEDAWEFPAGVRCGEPSCALPAPTEAGDVTCPYAGTGSGSVRACVHQVQSHTPTHIPARTHSMGSLNSSLKNSDSDGDGSNSVPVYQTPRQNARGWPAG